MFTVSVVDPLFRAGSGSVDQFRGITDPTEKNLTFFLFFFLKRRGEIFQIKNVNPDFKKKTYHTT